MAASSRLGTQPRPAVAQDCASRPGGYQTAEIAFRACTASAGSLRTTKAHVAGRTQDVSAKYAAINAKAQTTEMARMMATRRRSLICGMTRALPRRS
jgi:hypothetical protein